MTDSSVAAAIASVAQTAPDGLPSVVVCPHCDEERSLLFSARLPIPKEGRMHECVALECFECGRWFAIPRDHEEEWFRLSIVEQFERSFAQVLDLMN